jgi:hypothetical protein
MSHYVITRDENGSETAFRFEANGQGGLFYVLNDIRGENRWHPFSIKPVANSPKSFDLEVPCYTDIQFRYDVGSDSWAIERFSELVPVVHGRDLIERLWTSHKPNLD